MPKSRIVILAFVLLLSCTAVARVAQAEVHDCDVDADCPGVGRECLAIEGIGTRCNIMPPCTTDADCGTGRTCKATSATTKACGRASYVAWTPPPASASSPTNSSAPAQGTKLTNPLGTESIPAIISNIISAAVGIVGALALLMFIYGGFRWLTSAGDAGKIQEGKDAMKWAAIGLVVIFSSYALVSFVLKALT